jgi:multisubunit Na+/H+ antiporter MnhE subunit
MTLWRFWFHTLVLSSQYNPPRFVELLMLLLAIALLGIWQITPNWPYLALSLSYIVGASVSILVREAIVPSPQIRATQVTAVLLLIISIYGFADLIRYL